MAGINYTKTLTLTLDTDEVQCQLTTAQLVDEPEGAETLTTFCGSQDVAGTPKRSLTISGYQDWGQAQSVFDMLHAAYIADVSTDPTANQIDCVLTVGTATRTFTAVPQNDPPFGGDAGAAMTADVTLSVVGAVTDGTVPVGP